MNIKVDVNVNNLKAGSVYKFKSNTHSDYFEATFLSLSRIDSFPIFDLVSYPKGNMIDYNILEGAIVKSFEIVAALEDHLPEYRCYSDNFDKIVEYLFEVNGISKYDLYKKDAYTSIIRDLKLKGIVK